MPQINSESTSDSRIRSLPRHVAIIMDGNGRWAKNRGLPRSLGHKAGVETLREIIQHTNDLGISALTVFAFSTENWKRSIEEVGFLMGLLLEYFKKELDELHRKNVRIRILGDIDAMPDAFLRQKEALRFAEEKTKSNTGLRLSIAINYGGQQEIIHACQEIGKVIAAGSLSPDDIDKHTVEEHLYTSGLPEVDLLIRTSGEMRISNFLLWQIAYAEFYITDKLWPDFNVSDYDLALSAYGRRDRRFGGITERQKR